MKVRLARFILHLFGWKIVGAAPPEKKYIGIMAPHTSNFDFIWGKLASWALHSEFYAVIKKELFFFPLGPILRLIGSIPVDRRKSNALIRQLLYEFNRREKLAVIFTPEGSRSKTKRWKTGFFYIAKKIDVPVYFTFIDYKKNELGIAHKLDTERSQDEVMADVKSFYKDITPKHPAYFTI